MHINVKTALHTVDLKTPVTAKVLEEHFDGLSVINFSEVILDHDRPYDVFQYPPSLKFEEKHFVQARVMFETDEEKTVYEVTLPLVVFDYLFCHDRHTRTRLKMAASKSGVVPKVAPLFLPGQPTTHGVPTEWLTQFQSIRCLFPE